jgi:hypothetical protein
MNFKVSSLTLLSLVLASPPSSSYCKQARTVYTIAASQCAIAAGISGPFGVFCGVGVGLYTISIEIACGVAGHFVGEELPLIATKLSNGTVVDLPGDQVYDLEPISEDTHALRKRSTTLCGAGLDCITVDYNLYVNLGRTAGGSEHCSNVGEQRCITGQRAFITCGSGNKWAIQQACGAGTRCQTHPNTDSRILCGW